MLRARRNDRRLTVGDSHVRNGDRFRVLGPGPQDGLIVEDLTGRGRAVLPADYLSRHAEYGWASTIDAAQGATADVGIVLVRPGMDREHLYVAMTRGRHGNHAYVTPDLTSDDDHHGHTAPRPSPEAAVRSPQEQARAGARGRAPAQRRAGRRAHRARTGARPGPGPGRADRPRRPSMRRSGPPHATRPRRNASAGTPGRSRRSTPEPCSSSTSAGPSASSSARTATPCTSPCSRPVSSSSSCRAGRAGDAAPSPTR